jgi:hypothetical protein
MPVLPRKIGSKKRREIRQNSGVYAFTEGNIELKRLGDEFVPVLLQCTISMHPHAPLCSLAIGHRREIGGGTDERSAIDQIANPENPHCMAGLLVLLL